MHCICRTGVIVIVIVIVIGIGIGIGIGIVLIITIIHRTRILLNGKESNVSVRTVVMWMLLSFSICACTCCCVVLVFAQNGFDDEEDPQQASRRPVRRRLTLEQVRARFPSFHFNPQEHHQNNNNCSDCGCGNDGDDNGGEEAIAVAVEQQKGYMQLSDECTICLDEFTPGVRVRELPCGHVFHSTCIARWFIERSAVCPLCKLDLYEEPVEDDNEDDNDNNDGNDRGETGEASPGQTPFSFFGSWWSGRSTTTTNSEGYTQLEIPPGDTLEAIDTAAEGAVREGATATAGGEEVEEETRSWWPFSLETAPSTDEEEQQQHHSDNRRRRPRSSPLPSAAGVISWTMTNVFGRGGSRSSRRRHGHEQQPNQESTNDGNGNDNMVTELTEPLVPRGSLMLEEARFSNGRVDNITNNDAEGTTIHHQTHGALLPDINNNSNANVEGLSSSTSAEV